MEDETILDLYFAREERAIAETGKEIRRLLPLHCLQHPAQP